MPMEGETDVNISHFALEKKGMERCKTFQHDPDFYLYSLNNIRYKDSLLVKLSFILGWKCTLILS